MSDGPPHIFMLLAAALALPSQSVEPDFQGHKFLSRAMMDGANGHWRQLYSCECGAVFMVSCEKTRAPLQFAMSPDPCPLAEAAT